jgi:hypothetical protein
MMQKTDTVLQAWLREQADCRGAQMSIEWMAAKSDPAPDFARELAS